MILKLGLFANLAIMPCQTDAKFGDSFRPFVSIANAVTYAGFHLQPREKPFNAKLSLPHPSMKSLAIDFDKHYRHALMYPGQSWSVFSPTDPWTLPTEQLAEWSCLEKRDLDDLP